MDNTKKTLAVLISAVVITLLFHRQSLGLNLWVFETIFFLWIIYTKQLPFKGLLPITVSISLILTSAFTVFTHSTFSYVINFLVLLIFIGIIIYPEAKSLTSVFGLSLNNLFNSQSKFINELSSTKLRGKNPVSLIRKFRIFIIPILIIIVFIAIYRNSNPVFNNVFESISLYLQKVLDFIFKDFDFLIIITFLISLLVSIFLVIQTRNQRLIKSDLEAKEELTRQRRNRQKAFKINALSNELKSGVFLFIILNIILLVLNIIDIKWVWFSFEWQGQYLKQFVHEGTYLLILSIIISIILVLYYFRSNLNFFSNNKLLKLLSFIWIIQNGILTISVAIRNFWYIKYFALAYKRIGVIIFLVLTIYGLYTVFIKVRQKKSAFYLFRTNTYAIFVVLILSSIINWDIIIAKYNFKNSDKSFLHLDYLVTLSDKTLPYLDISIEDLKQINTIQKERFPFEQKFLSPYDYQNIIETRKRKFLEKWSSKGIRSWNFPEYKAQKIFHKGQNENQ